MLEDVERGHDVELSRAKRQLQHVGVADVLESSLAAELEGLVRDVDSFHLAVQRELLKHQARATSGIEDVQVGAARIALANPIEHDVAPRGQPPMGCFGVVEDLVGVKVQPAYLSKGARSSSVLSGWCFDN